MQLPWVKSSYVPRLLDATILDHYGSSGSSDKDGSSGSTDKDGSSDNCTYSNQNHLQPTQCWV